MEEVGIIPKRAVARVPVVIAEAGRSPIRAVAKVPVVICEASILPIWAVAKVPSIKEAGICPNRAVAKVPVVIAEAGRLPIRAVAKVPEVILSADKAGTSSAARARKEGTPLEPSGEARIKLAFWLARSISKVPAVEM